MNQFFQANKNFLKDWNYFIPFVTSSPEVQVMIILKIYAFQTCFEKELKNSIDMNGRGFAKGSPASRFSEIAENLGVAAYEKLSYKDKSYMRMIHRYFPQYITVIMSEQNIAEMIKIKSMYDEYADRCRKLKELTFVRVSVNKAFEPDRKRLSEFLKIRNVESVEKAYNSIKNSKIQPDLFD